MLPGMIADRELSRVTLEQFRREVAGEHPMPAGVAIAAVSAGFALGLLAKVLAVSGRHNALPEHTARLGPATAAAQAASQRLVQLAGEDTTAFEAYLTARRLPSAAEAERHARQEAVRSATRRAIDVPLTAAQEAAAGLQLCGEMADLVPPVVIADVGVAASLLTGALQGLLLCAKSNVEQLGPDGARYRERLAAETRRYEQAVRQAEAVLGRARSALQAAAAAGGEP